MIKKIIAGTVLSAMTLFATPNNKLDLMVSDKVSEKKARVLSNLKLQGETKQEFENLYVEYQVKLMKHRIFELAMISDYALKYQNMTAKYSDEIIESWLALEEEKLALKKEYIKKFKEIMPAADVIRYFQIENRIQLENEIGKTHLIPLARSAKLKEK